MKQNEYEKKEKINKPQLKIIIPNFMKKIVASLILVSVLSSCGSSAPVLEKYYSTRIAEKTDIDLTQSYV